MEPKDILWGQNWIEQFRANVGVYPCEAVRIENMRDLYTLRHVSVSYMIYYAFVWSRTPQHPDGEIDGVWWRRWGGEYGESQSRARLHP